MISISQRQNYFPCHEGLFFMESIINSKHRKIIYILWIYNSSYKNQNLNFQSQTKERLGSNWMVLCPQHTITLRMFSHLMTRKEKGCFTEFEISQVSQREERQSDNDPTGFFAAFTLSTSSFHLVSSFLLYHSCEGNIK